MEETDQHETILLFGIVAAFVVSLAISQVIASKLASYELPVLGVLMYPVGSITYAVLFICSDLMSELFGKKKAAYMVNIGFAMNFLLLAFVWAAIYVPNSGAGASQGAFEEVLTSSTNIVFASLAAYLISQNLDVWLFHKIRAITGVKRLWLRNVGSTTVSQFVDAIAFTTVAYLLLPSLTGIGQTFGLKAAALTVLGQYFIVVGVAVLDTPIVYAIVHGVEKHTGLERADVTSV